MNNKPWNQRTGNHAQQNEKKYLSSRVFLGKKKDNHQSKKEDKRELKVNHIKTKIEIIYIKRK